MVNSLSIPKAPADTRVIVAMSGGVDSSVTAALLVEQGYEVIGITLQLYDHGAISQSKGACCAGADIHDARTVAASLGIPHYVLDYESQFRQKVMDDFADSYLAGHTPIPCVRCNQTVKFTDLLQTAMDLGADCLATGHYIRRDIKQGHPCLRRGIDEKKDQSYFLFATTPEQLVHLRFPLGGMTKSETRRLAAQFGLSVRDKPDSQDICFVPKGRYGDIVRKLRPGAVEAGKIRHLDGTVLGSHDGVIDYTIGQRRGLGIGGRNDASDDEGPLYVVGIDAATHTVLVGPQSALACQTVWLEDVNLIAPTLVTAGTDSGKGRAVLAKLRNTAISSPARLFIMDGQRAKLVLDQPEYGIACGQAGVFYDAEEASLMLGGGWITNAPTIAEKDQFKIKAFASSRNSRF